MILLVAAAFASAPLASWDLEQDDGGLTSGGELGQWAWGAVATGPGGGYDGARAWAVGLAAPYLNDSVEYLEFPLPALGGAAAPVLSFHHWYAFGKGDHGHVEIDQGVGYHAVAPIYGYPHPEGWAGSSAGWEQATIQLPTDTLRARLVFVSDANGVGLGWFIDNAGVWDGDVTAPRVTRLDSLDDTEQLDAPYLVTATLEDDTRVLGASLDWSTSRGDSGSEPMVEGAPDEWSASIPAQLPDTTVTYAVSATDGANDATWPSTGESFRVYLPAPTDLVGPTGRVVGTTVPLSWAAPLSVHAVLGYTVFRNGDVVASPTVSAADVPVTGGSDEFTVAARYAAGTGDRCAPWGVDAVVPSLVEVSPASGYAGDHLRVEVYGDRATFVDGEVTVDFGAGITTEAVAVRDVDRLVAELLIDPAAMAGERTVTVTSAVGPVSLDAGFLVRDAASRPQLTTVEPDTVRQGAQGTLEVGFVGDLADTPTVELGEGIVVEAVRIRGDVLEVDYAVAVTAPVGEHSVTADDGVRQLDGANLTVRDWTPGPVQTCATGTGAPAPLLLLAGASALYGRRRRR